MSRVISKTGFFAITTAALLAPPAGAQPIDICGILVQGVNQCVLFELGDGTRYLLDSEGGFLVGTQVHVVGTIQPTCYSICLQGNGCIAVQLIELCQAQVAPPPSLPSDSCGPMCGVALPGAGMASLAGWVLGRWKIRRFRRRRPCGGNSVYRPVRA